MTVTPEGRRSRRRADGSLRPADARHRRRYRKKRRIKWLMEDGWLGTVDYSTAVWAREVAVRLDITWLEASEKLEAFAEKARWRKKRDYHGRVVLIAQPRARKGA